MALSTVETKVLFGAANSISIGSGFSNSSDDIVLHDDCIKSSITLKADNAGTPAQGDVVDIYYLGSSGDPDGAAVVDEFASPDTTHAIPLGQINTFATNPGIITIDYPNVPKKGRLFTVNRAGSAVTFSAVVEESRTV